MTGVLFKALTKEGGYYVEGYYAKLKRYVSEEDFHIIIPVDTTMFPHGGIDYFEEILPETLSCLDESD